MTFNDVLVEYREVFVSMINKFLDTLYETDKNDISAPMYETLRRAVIDEEELTLIQQRLILLLVVLYLNKSKSIIEVHTKAVHDFSIIKSDLEKILL